MLHIGVYAELREQTQKINIKEKNSDFMNYSLVTVLAQFNWKIGTLFFLFENFNRLAFNFLLFG
jgi:hypothetical protein